MERQTKHRILGMLVIIGLVIILLPLFQSNRDLSSEATTLITAPPFPDQPAQVTSNESEPAASNPVQPEATKPTTTLPQTSNSTLKHEADDIINAIHPSVVENTQQPKPDTSVKVLASQTTHDRSALPLVENTDNDSVQIHLPPQDITQSEMASNKSTHH